MIIEGPYRLRNGQYRVSVDGRNILFATKAHADRFVYEARIRAIEDQNATFEDFFDIAQSIVGDAIEIQEVDI